MKKKIVVVIPLFLLSLLLSCVREEIEITENSPKPAIEVRRPAVSGMFYPGDAFTLKNEVDEFLQRSEKETIDGKLIALIAPHAGYQYSGQVAAFAYKQLEGKKIDTVILIGPSHRTRFSGVSVGNYGYYQTPLGKVAVDTKLAERMMEGNKLIGFYPPAHQQEHCLEVQLPFLQRTLTKFKMLPLVIGSPTLETCRELSQVLLKETKGKNILLIASTDMSHYHSYDEACRIDNVTIKELQKLNPQSLHHKIAARECELCGAGAVIATLLYTQAKGGDEVKILKHANSGDTCGDKQRVVGYLSAAIFARKGRKKMVGENKGVLNEKQKKRLLDIARRTIDEYITSGKKLDFTEDDSLLLKNMGAFVTIHKQGSLRGCIGNIIGQQPLYLTVRDMAIQSATADPRFPPVAPDELKDIDIEISVLSEPKKVENTDEIKMGVHGVIVKKGYSSGVYLPQVARETGWTKEEFLSNLCAGKAGLSPEAWKDKDTELYSFTAQVFGEK